MKRQSGLYNHVSFLANCECFIFLKNPTYLKSPIARIKNITAQTVQPSVKKLNSCTFRK